MPCGSVLVLRRQVGPRPDTYACIDISEGQRRWRAESWVPSLTVLGPARLRRFSQRFAALLGTNIPPPRCAKADGRSVNRVWREFSTGDVEEFNRHIEQRLRWQACMAHQAAQSCRSACAENSRELGCEYGAGVRP